MRKTPIQIVGGGLSGLMLGIHLRRRDVPVTLHEASGYPRHRVCGEFLSGRGVDLLREVGLLERLSREGARWAGRVAFYSESRRLHQFDLPRPALCLSRYKLDAVLAETLTAEGGTLEKGRRVGREMEGPGVVWATGRRRKSREGGWRWFGLKAHLLDMPLEADLEMHLHPDAYIGACRVEAGQVNLCGLFRAKVNGSGPSVDPAWDRLRGLRGSPLWERARQATFLEASRSAVAALDLRPHRAGCEGTFRLGDALTMIPPVTGNGMSMALESAAMAAGSLALYSEGRLGWEETMEEAAGRMDRCFKNRLGWAQWIQRCLFSPIARPWLLKAGRHSGRVWRACFEKTR